MNVLVQFLWVFLATSCDIRLSIFIEEELPGPPPILSVISDLNSEGIIVCYNGMITSQSQLVQSIRQGQFDFLLAFNSDVDFPIWADSTLAAIVEGINTNKNQKIMIWDRYCDGDVKVPGLNLGSVVSQSILDIEATTDDPPTKGPYGTWNSFTGCSAAHGYVVDSLLSQLYDVFAVNPTNEKPVSIRYCYGGTSIWYSTHPADYYLYGGLATCGYEPAIVMIKNAFYFFVKETRSYCNAPPICNNVILSKSWIPPNGKFVEIKVQGVAQNPDGGDVSIRVIFCDSSEKARNDCIATDDPSIVAVRARRNGPDGRLYKIGYVALDEVGGDCSGYAYVCIPHSAATKNHYPSSKAKEHSLCPSVDGVENWYIQFQ